MRNVISIIFILLNAITLFSQHTYISPALQAKLDSTAHYQDMIKGLQVKIEDLKLQQLRADIKKIGLPQLAEGEALIEHSAMYLVYSEAHEQAKWVAHIITPDIKNGTEGRSNDFRPDDKILTGSAIEEDYFLKQINADSTVTYDGFGYDRGHLAPSADFRWSSKSLSESYLYSNMSPMKAEFNRDSWAKLEDLVRSYLYRNAETQLFVVTGPILKEGLPTVPRAVHHVSIPEQYFKVIIDYKNERGIAFVMPNKKSDAPLETFAISIDELEAMTDIDFFSGIEDDKEANIEAQKDHKPFMSDREKEDIVPDHPTKLPRNTYNTVMAKGQMGNGRKIRVIGTVVSTKLSSKGNVFLNLDKKFPNQIFSVSIFADKMANFSYFPHEHLEGKKIIVSGVVTNFNGTPTISVDNEDQIEIID